MPPLISAFCSIPLSGSSKRSGRWPPHETVSFENEEFAAGYRRQVGELGWYSHLVPEEMEGGAVSGNRVIDAALVAYERGKELPPDPFVGTNVVANVLAAEGTDEQRGDQTTARDSRNSLPRRG
jgi:alkylation response protein AidB-like acyl-CoA dehydrogenase